ncbi:MAG: ABC transporter ATP-binding protein [Alphaproteobacteria bacterium]
MTAGLEIDGVNHAYGTVEAVRDVSLRVAAGELVALLGPSGCGKSTVLRLTAGLEHLQQGAVRIAGETVAEPGREVPPEARSVGLMFQDFALFPHLTVARNVGFGVSGHSTEVVAAALERVGLADRADDYPHALSGGEQQRVALARALAPRPKVMLLDEPFSGLDVVLRDRIRETTAAILRESGTPTLMVTHDPEEAMLMADRIALMRDGRIVQEGPPDSLYRNPKSAFCATFIGDANSFDGQVSSGAVATPLGDFAAPDHADGTPARVLIRPEGIRLDATDGATDGVEAAVVLVRSSGRAGLVTLELDDAQTVVARLFWTDLPRPGDKVRISADHAMAFVFCGADR